MSIFEMFFGKNESDDERRERIFEEGVRAAEESCNDPDRPIIQIDIAPYTNSDDIQAWSRGYKRDNFFDIF